MMFNSQDAFTVGINDKLALGPTLIFALQHLLALTGIWVFPVIIGSSLGLSAAQTGSMIQACFLCTGLVTILQSSRLLKLPIVQGPTAAFMVAVIGAGHSVGLATTFGSMFVAALIFAVLALPLKTFGLMGHLIRYISPPLVFGSLLLIIGAQLASIGPNGWFSTASGGSIASSAVVALITVLSVIACMVLGGIALIRQGALLWGMMIGVLCFVLLTDWHLPDFSQTALVALPQVFAYGFQVSWPIVVLMMLAYLQASAEAMGMYSLLAGWGGQTLSTARVNRGLCAEFIGGACGAAFGALGTTSYPENVGIIRMSGIASRYVTLTAGSIAMLLGLFPKIGLFLASLPVPVLSAASSLLFGVIAISGIQILAKVQWDDCNLAVAAPAFIISLGSMYLPASVIALLPESLKMIIAQPMMLGVMLLIGLNIIVNILLRPRLKLGKATISSQA
jgi:xanthine/uracil permease